MSEIRTYERFFAHDVGEIQPGKPTTQQRQIAICKSVLDFTAEHGHAPVYEQIAEHMAQGCEAGVMRRGYGRHRAVEVVS